jgi:arylformamidase
MPGIPSIPFYEQNPVKVQAVTLVREEQRALLQSRGVDVSPGAEIRGSMNTVFTMNSHIGTHIDAPRHFYPEFASIDEVALDRIVMREAMVLDLSHKGPDSIITGDDLEKTGVKPQSHQIPVIKTLWTDRKWGTSDFWAHMICLDPSVSEWTTERRVPAVAMDCFPERPFWRMTLKPEERALNHKTWLKAGIPMIQFLTNLASLGERFTLVALPLRLKGMDGSPARVVGIEA